MVSSHRSYTILPDRRLERAWKALWFRAVEATLRRRGRRRPRDLHQRPLRVLFLRHDRLGDAIVSSPLLRALADSGVVVDVLCSRRNQEVLRRYPFLGKLHLYEKRPVALIRLAIRLRRASYDAAIDPIVTKRSMTSMLLMLASGASETIGFGACGPAGLTHPVSGDAASEPIGNLLAKLGQHFGIEPPVDPVLPELPVDEDELAWGEAAWKAAGDRPRLLINSSGGHSAREWPAERYVEVIAGIRERFPEAAVLVVGAPDAWERVSSIASAAAVTAAATPGLGLLIGLVATADFVFTPDTSVAHVAAAFRRPAVAMYLPGTAGQWGIPGPSAVNVESATDHLVGLPVQRILPTILERIAMATALQPPPSTPVS